MKRMPAAVLALALALCACASGGAETVRFPGGPVIGIAWRADTDSMFFTNVCRAIEAAGGR